MIGETLSPKMKFPQFLPSSRMDFGLLMFTGLGLPEYFWRMAEQDRSRDGFYHSLTQNMKLY